MLDQTKNVYGFMEELGLKTEIKLAQSVTAAKAMRLSSIKENSHVGSDTRIRHPFIALWQALKSKGKGERPSPLPLARSGQISGSIGTIRAPETG